MDNKLNSLLKQVSEIFVQENIQQQEKTLEYKS